MTETFYDALGVSETADQDEIRDAYREKVKEYHPDVSDRDDAAERFKAITRAEEVLGDEAERARYDRLGHDAYVRHLDGSNAATSEESPWTSTDQSDGSDAADGTDGSASTRERARSAAGTGDDGGTSQHRKRRRQRRYHEQRREASWSTGSDWEGNRTDASGKAAGGAADAGAADASANSRTAETGANTGARKTAGGSAGTDGGAGARNTDDGAGERNTGGGSTYAVHDWEPAERSFIGGRPSLTKNALFQTVVLGLLYPVLLYSSVTPAFPILVNLLVAALTLVLIGYLITLPLVAGTVFGVWSVLAPLAMTSLGFELFSLPVIVAALGCWIPLGYSVTVAFVLRW